MPPLLSIVTINRNDSPGLKRTLESVRSQTSRDFQQIVIDGGSEDGSVDCLRQFSDVVSTWISEPDRGVYEAQNKGIRLAEGQFLLFLNSGDHLADSHVLERASTLLDNTDLHYFDLIVRSDPGTGAEQEYLKTYPDRLDFSYLAVDSLPHPATFIRRDLFSRHGLYDEGLRICADWKQFILWVCRHNCSYRHHSWPLSVFYLDGLSSQDLNRVTLNAERQRVLAEEFPAFQADLKLVLENRNAAQTLAALRTSRVVRLAQRTRLLWKF